MGTLRIDAPVPNRVYVDRCHVKRQRPLYQLFGNTRHTQKMFGQYREQVGVGDHPTRRKKLVDCQHNLPFAEMAANDSSIKPYGRPEKLTSM